MNDFDVSIFLLTEDGELIPNKEFDYKTIHDVQFIVLTNDRLNPDYDEDCTIYMHKDMIKQRGNIFGEYCILKSGFLIMQWQINDYRLKDIPRITEDCVIDDEFLTKHSINGYKTSNDIIQSVCKSLVYSKDEFIPAVMSAYNTCVTYNTQTIHGYLPEIGQLIFINKNISEIYLIFKKITKQITISLIRTNDNRDVLSGNYISSTSNYDDQCYYLTYGTISLASKSKGVVDGQVMPLFKIK